MENKLKILELTKYYIERYSLDTSYSSSSSENTLDNLGTFNQAITRIIKNTTINDVSLWEIINIKGKARQISIIEFEKLCLPSLIEYIEKNCTDYDKKQLINDKNRLSLQQSKDYWDELAKKAIDDHNEGMRNLIDISIDDSDNEMYFSKSSEEIREKGINMMIEAIYNIFYEPFDWNLLSYDMNNTPIDEGYNPEITGEMLRSEKRLQDYQNYIGKRKLRL